MFPAKVHGFEEVQFSPKGTVFTKLSSKISPGAFSLSEGIVLYVLGPMLSRGWCSATNHSGISAKALPCAEAVDLLGALKGQQKEYCPIRMQGGCVL